ncbi:MAG TPA: hypothetical protein VLM85_31325 [Polyangiaceae bacterium]|nr:hypothetical protein [Polyangiaceae bacterium]
MLHIYLFIIETLKLLAPIVRRIAEHDPDLARQMKRAGSASPSTPPKASAPMTAT